MTLPERTGFHVFRHTYASWMRQYGGLDIRGLVGTGTWADLSSASRYVHVVASEESRRADLLPTEEKEFLWRGNRGEMWREEKEPPRTRVLPW
jgi:integrase